MDRNSQRWFVGRARGLCFHDACDGSPQPRFGRGDSGLDALTVSAQVENSGPPGLGEERMSRLGARLDNGEFSTAAVLPGRQVQLLQDPGYGGQAPARLQVLPSTRDSAWTTLQ
jgi:hypothetical protein